MTWSEPLQTTLPFQLLGLNWVAAIEAQSLRGVHGQAIGNTTFMALKVGGLKTGDNVIDYLATEPDVLALSDGHPAEQFFDFPVEIV